MVPPLRSAVAHGRRSVSGLPAGVDRLRPLGVRLPRTGPRGRPSPEVLGMARCGGGTRRGPRRALPAAGRRRDLGAARSPAAGRAWLRPGLRARTGARTRAPAPGSCLRPPGHGDLSAITPDTRGAVAGDGRCVRRHPAPARARAAPPRRRRLDDGRHRLRLCRRAHPGRRPRDPRAHGVPVLLGPASRPEPAAQGSAAQGSAARTTRFASALRPCLYSEGAPVRVCGCPGTNPGSRCQPRAKRPT